MTAADRVPERPGVLSLWRELHDYARRATADLDDALMVAQPIPGVRMNHPAWILSHLWAYAPALAGILRGEAVEDPKHHRFGMGSTPADRLDQYGDRDEVIGRYLAGYEDAAAAYERAAAERLAEPTPVERWRGRFPTIGVLPMQFLVRHNATHLGQLSAWRRALGLPPV